MDQGVHLSGAKAAVTRWKPSWEAGISYAVGVEKLEAWHRRQEFLYKDWVMRALFHQLCEKDREIAVIGAFGMICSGILIPAGLYTGLTRSDDSFRYVDSACSTRNLEYAFVIDSCQMLMPDYSTFDPCRRLRDLND
ncbi:uncharacterized protein F4807DRAFT_455915 [Annulohypoxylon truncatum]|uniref:uncharacterized protein n=1 Tax=Annulohypoxylon truncatum TaxID=327061 RepID=UPI002007D8B6|nr:uncharacterized protein F4807DRAFT_455915 [Annulohypoxylon truncatum]KAI1214274.1 hypothetical protein F4807DRAFT_455915 [Annulohypoxylon truncatum]